MGHGRRGPARMLLGWLCRALGLGFVLGAAVGVRAARHDGRVPGAHEMADRVERAMRVLAGREAGAPATGETGGDTP